MNSAGCMQANVHLSNASVTLSQMQVEEMGYPKPVRDILEAAGVLDAVPYSAEPVLAGGSGVPLPRPLSYEWSDEGAGSSAASQAYRVHVSVLLSSLGHQIAMAVQQYGM